MTASMTAAVLVRHGDPEALTVRNDVPVPTPGPGQVLVRVAAAALNNTDVWTREGAYGLPGRPDGLAGWRGPITFPRVQGGDLTGRVDTAGPGVDAERVGERVLVDPAFYDGAGDDARPVGLLGSEADGGFAEYAVVDARRAHDVTTSPLSDDELACLPIAYGTAAGMLARAQVRSGETVVVTGASGGVGFALVQLAAARGARVVAATRDEAADAVRAAGAETVVPRDGTGLATAAPDSIDVVADVVGGPALAGLVDGLVEGGRLVVAGAVAGPVVEFDLRRLYLHNRLLIGSSMHTPAHFAELVTRARAGDLAPRIAGRYRLDEVHEAQRAFQAGGYVGKIVVRPGS